MSEERMTKAVLSRINRMLKLKIEKQNDFIEEAKDLLRESRDEINRLRREVMVRDLAIDRLMEEN